MSKAMKEEQNPQGEDQSVFDKDKGNLLYRVFLRRTGAVNNHDGTYIIQEEDIRNWFENGDHLKDYTTYDLM